MPSKHLPHEMNLTEGNLFLKIPKFAIPFMMTTIFQLLYTTIDLWTVSKFGGGSLSMSAIGSNTALINLVITFLVSLATGANVVISQAKGANDHDRAEKALHTAFIIAVLGGILISVFAFFMTPVFLTWMGTPASIFEKSSQYLHIYFLGIPLLMIYNFGSQMLRALGDSKRPLYILVISGLVNVFFDLVFVIFFGMDVSGVAIATVISEAVSATLTILWFVFNKKGFVCLRWSRLRVDSKSLGSILRIGVPAGIQGLAFCIPNVLIQSSLYTITDYSIGGVAISQDEIVAGASASAQIEGYVFAIIDAFAVTLISFVGQNCGARKKENVKKCFWFALSWQLIFWGVAALVVGLFPYVLLRIFISDSEGVVMQNCLLAGRERLYLMAFTYCLDGLMDIFSNYLRGMKVSTPPAIITSLGCTGTRILFLLFLFPTAFFHTIYWLYAAFPISWILTNLVYVPVTFHYEKKILNPLGDSPSKESAAC